MALLYSNRKQKFCSLVLSLVLSLSLLLLFTDYSRCETEQENSASLHTEMRLPSNQHFSLEFVSVTRDAPHVKYASIARLDTNEEGAITSVDMLTEDWNDRDVFHFSSSKANPEGKLISFMDANKSEQSCLSSSSNQPGFSIHSLNEFIGSLKELNKQQLQASPIYDQSVNDILLNNGDLRVFLGVFKFISEEEFILVLTDSSMSQIRYIIGQNIMVTFAKFSPTARKSSSNKSAIAKKLKQLKAECLSIDEIMPIENEDYKINAPLVTEQMKEPWFADRSACCDSQHLRDESKCDQMKSKQILKVNGPGKVCVFLHGAGEEPDLPVLNKHKDYWGNIHEFTPQCSKRLFIRADTTRRGWDSTYLQKTFCDLAANHDTGSSGTVIKNTIVFAHSMGNLILAAGIKNGYCSFNKDSSWYAINPPFGGSPAATKLKSICHVFYSQKPSSLSVDNLYGIVATKAGYCDRDTRQPFLSYLSLQPNYCSPDGQCLDDLGDVIKENVKGIMCGSSSFGMKSKYSVLLSALSQIVQYGEENDGMVGVSSCSQYHKGLFNNNHKAKFYQSPVNHADGTCRNSNGMFSQERKPCSYFEHKV